MLFLPLVFYKLGFRTFFGQQIEYQGLGFEGLGSLWGIWIVPSLVLGPHYAAAIHLWLDVQVSPSHGSAKWTGRPIGFRWEAGSLVDDCPLSFPLHPRTPPSVSSSYNHSSRALECRWSLGCRDSFLFLRSWLYNLDTIDTITYNIFFTCRCRSLVVCSYFDSQSWIYFIMFA